MQAKSGTNQLGRKQPRVISTMKATKKQRLRKELLFEPTKRIELLTDHLRSDCSAD